MTKQYVAVVGTVLLGFQVYGPFTDAEAACGYGASMGQSWSAECWVAELQEPELSELLPPQDPSKQPCVGVVGGFGPGFAFYGPLYGLKEAKDQVFEWYTPWLKEVYPLELPDADILENAA